MARRYGRRRFNKGPSKNEKKVSRRNTDDASGRPLREVFPEVLRLGVEKVWTDAEGRPFQEDNNDFSSADPVDLKVACPGICGGTGNIDLTPKLESMVEGKVEKDEGQATCDMDRFGSPGEACGFTLKAVLTVSY